MTNSEYITLAQAENLVAGAGFADILGYPLNRHLEISFEGMETPGRLNDAKTAFMRYLGDFLSYTRIRLFYIFVWERGYVKGLHLHILIHIPSELLPAVKRHIPNWLKAIGATYNESGWEIKDPTRYREGVNRWNPLKGRLRYILKGIDPSIEGVTQEIKSKRHGRGKHGPLGILPSPQGIVPFKRAGTSQNIGPFARASHANPESRIGNYRTIKLVQNTQLTDEKCLPVRKQHDI